MAAWPGRIVVLLDEPCKGTGLIAVEGSGEQFGVSIWSYLYGPDRVRTAEQHEPRWTKWLAEHADASRLRAVGR